MNPGLRHRHFVVLLANNDHGKTTLVRSLVSQGTRRAYTQVQKNHYILYSRRAQEIDAYIFPRSYQEVEKKKHPLVTGALDSNDPEWWKRDLILMPSHLDQDDCASMIEAAHSEGFDALAVTLCITRTRLRKLRGYHECMSLGWDARWRVNNPETDDWSAQVEALGRDLWGALSSRLFP